MHLVMFDVDGTLVDSVDFDTDLYAKAVEAALGLRISCDWAGYKNVTDSGILDQILDENRVYENRPEIHARVRRLFTALVSTHLKQHSGSVKEIPGARALLELLGSLPGVRVAVATGGWRETALLKLRAVGIDADELPFGSASDAVSRIEIMKSAERRALKEENALRKTYFGDAPWDKEASEALQYRFIAVGDRVDHHTGIPDFQNLGAVRCKLGI